jgi:single-strand DNA-binding protein
MIVIGNLGADPELRYTSSNKAVCNMRVATSYKPKTGAEVTEWHRVVAYDTTADNCVKYLKKGRSVYVEGRLQTRQYERDGQKHSSTEIVAERVVFMGGKEEMGPRNVEGTPRTPAQQPAQQADYDDSNF